MSVGPERVRVLVVGDSGVGKTSLTSLIAQGASLPSPGWTVGCSVEVKLHQYLGMAWRQYPLQLCLVWCLLG